MKNKIFIYLARRDKKGIKILTSFNHSNSYPPTKINDLKQLNLPENIYKSLYKEFSENKMLYELWMQSSDSFESLKKSLTKRGYSNLPLHKSILYTTRTSKEEKNINLKSTKTMLRKNSKDHRLI